MKNNFLTIKTIKALFFVLIIVFLGGACSSGSYIIDVDGQRHAVKDIARIEGRTYIRAEVLADILNLPMGYDEWENTINFFKNYKSYKEGEPVAEGNGSYTGKLSSTIGSKQFEIEEDTTYRMASVMDLEAPAVLYIKDKFYFDAMVLAEFGGYEISPMDKGVKLTFIHKDWQQAYHDALLDIYSVFVRELPLESPYKYIYLYGDGDAIIEKAQYGYLLYDIDNSGIPELIILDASKEPNSSSAIFYYMPEFGTVKYIVGFDNIYRPIDREVGVWISDTTNTIAYINIVNEDFDILEEYPNYYYKDSRGSGADYEYTEEEYEAFVKKFNSETELDDALVMTKPNIEKILEIGEWSNEQVKTWWEMP